MRYRSSVSFPYEEHQLGRLEGVFRNETFPHFYEMYREGGYYVVLQKGSHKSRLKLNQSEYLNFCRELLKNGWKEYPPGINI